MEFHGDPWRLGVKGESVAASGGRRSRIATATNTAVRAGFALAQPLAMEFLNDPVAGEIIGAAIEVHRTLGPGLMESTYQGCLIHELTMRGIRVDQQVPVPVVYKGIRLDFGYRLDLLVDADVIVEVKSVEKLMPIHTAQVLTYLRLTAARRALLLNFNGVTLKQGLRSFLGPGNVLPSGQP